MQVKQEQKTFMVRVANGSTKDSTACHLAMGTDALVSVVTEKLGRLSGESKERLRGLIEEDREHVVARFRGLNSLSLYNEHENKRLDVYMIMDSRGA